jgi:DNA-binding transcriptional LysR family regulator
MTISFNRLDLNLLRVFDAVMEERSVLRAGQRICLSQSAVSHALARLREMLGDELFIRTTAGMQPTARALAMAPLIRDAWGSLEAAIGLPKFEPGSSTRRFTIAASDFVTTVMGPRLLSLLRREAPHVDLVIRPESRIDLAKQIDLGQIDAAIGTFSGVPVRFRSNSLFSYDDVLIASSSLRLGKLSLETFSGLTVAAVSMHGEEEGVVGGFLSERGLKRRSEMYDRAALDRAFAGSTQSPRVALLLPHFLALPSLLEDTHLAAIVPRPLAGALVRMHPLSMLELPYRSGLVDVGALWHARNTGDAPQVWLHDMLRRSAEPLRPLLAELDRLAPRVHPAQARPAPSANANDEASERNGRSFEAAEPR